MSDALSVHALTARIGTLEILGGVDLAVPFGEIHALMGPNGSGKSTLCHVLMGKPGYEAEGSALVDGVEVIGADVDERSRAGLFQTFQYPIEIPGVTLRDLLAEMANYDGERFWERVEGTAARLEVAEFLDRPVNVGLSGGEKKRSEILQLIAAAPRVALLDEIDSGLDIDAVRTVAAAVEELRSPERGVLLITHYRRILQYLTVDRVHVMLSGRVVRSGDRSLADHLEDTGYEGLREELGLGPAGPAEEDPFPV